MKNGSEPRSGQTSRARRGWPAALLYLAGIGSSRRSWRWCSPARISARRITWRLPSWCPGSGRKPGRRSRGPPSLRVGAAPRPACRHAAGRGSRRRVRGGDRPARARRLHRFGGIDGAPHVLGRAPRRRDPRYARGGYGRRGTGVPGYFADLGEGARFVVRSRLVLSLVIVALTTFVMGDLRSGLPTRSTR